MEIPSGAPDFSKDVEFDGVLLWNYLRAMIKPNTKIGASQLKSEIKTNLVEYFDGNVLKFYKWFEDMKCAIMAEEGLGYNKYLRQIFWA